MVISNEGKWKEGYQTKGKITYKNGDIFEGLWEKGENDKG